jgi:calcyphosin
LSELTFDTTALASQHPDVLAGKMTADDALTHFLETFDVGGEVDGKVTKQEFINYYTNLGANIDNDDYFELMIRNAWHISGGEGWSANTANKRVLVTRVDGSQYVEEIKNDLGLKAGDKAGMMARLKAQGVDVASVSLFDGDQDKPPAQNQPLFTVQKPEKVTSKRITNTFRTTMTLGTEAVTVNKRRKPADQPSHGISLIISKLKGELKSRGGGGFIALQRKFRIMDDDGSKSLNLAEFKKAMKEMNMGLTDAELRMLFEHFDSDNSGSIDFEEFIQGVRDPLTERRQKLVEIAFDIIDTDGSCIVDAGEIMSKYDASKHPDVIAKKKTAEQVLNEWMATFEVGGVVDGCVTKQEFINYYTNIGASIDSDDYFELMIRNAWHISGGEGWSANTANKRVLVTRADGSQYVEEIKNDLGLKAGDKAGMMARLKAQGVDAKSISLHDGDKGKPVAGSQRVKVAAAGSTIDLSDGSIAKSASSSLAWKESKAGVPLTEVAQSKSVASTLDQLKQQLADRGARGIVGLQRKFKIMDDDGSQALSYSEFKKAMQECALTLNDQVS